MDIEAVYPDATTMTRALANLVYGDLLKDERLSNIQPRYEASVNLFYLSADKEPQQQVVYIPYRHSKSIDFQQLQALQNKLPHSYVFIAIADNTGTILYYQLTEGIFDKS